MRSADAAARACDSRADSGCGSHGGACDPTTPDGAGGTPAPQLLGEHRTDLHPRGPDLLCDRAACQYWTETFVSPGSDFPQRAVWASVVSLPQSAVSAAGELLPHRAVLPHKAV